MIRIILLFILTVSPMSPDDHGAVQYIHSHVRLPAGRELHDRNPLHFLCGAVRM